MILLEEFFQSEIMNKSSYSKITFETVDFVSDDSYQYFFFVKIKEGESITFVNTLYYIMNLIEYKLIFNLKN
jgi:hypothetical protein